MAGGQTDDCRWGEVSCYVAGSTRPEPVFEELTHCSLLLTLSVHSHVNLFIYQNQPAHSVL